MILAAGRGERMAELTKHTPKPLLKVGKHYLIDFSIRSLVKAGISDIVINVSYHADQIKDALGNGARYGVNIFYSEEKERLETGGGIVNALPLLGADPFVVLSCDVITDFPLDKLTKIPAGLAHLVVVTNPPYHARGDFGLHEGRLNFETSPTFTFANIGVYKPELFANCESGHFRLTKLLLPAISAGQMTGEHYHGVWHNVGTPEDLAIVNKQFSL